jgi:pimeloyl-ACP methyl ester carboxylesterase
VVSRLAWSAVPPLAWTITHAAAPAVRGWAPGAGRVQMAGPLSVRSLGDGQAVVLLFHGLLSSQAQFGAAYDRVADEATVLVPDLLGFAGSLDRRLEEVSLEDHLVAIDGALAALGLDDRPTVAAGHSLGSLLAIHWAARHPARTTAVVGWSPPLYRTEEEAFDGIGRLSPFTKALSRDTAIARRTCRWNCDHRAAAGWLGAALSPRLPVPVARAVSMHTWAAYRGAFDAVILNPSWEQQLHKLDQCGVPVRLVAGDADPLLVRGRVDELARALDLVTSETWSGDHHLPMTAPDRAAAQLTGLTRTAPG